MLSSNEACRRMHSGYIALNIRLTFISPSMTLQNAMRTAQRNCWNSEEDYRGIEEIKATPCTDAFGSLYSAICGPR